MRSEPAFPSHGTMGEVNYQGMTLRDYLAAKAMQGICAAMGELKKGCTQEAIAKEAYEIADAMLKHREA